MEAGQEEDHRQDDRQKCQQMGHRQQVGVLKLLLLSQVLRLRQSETPDIQANIDDEDVQARKTASIIMRVSSASCLMHVKCSKKSWLHSGSGYGGVNLLSVFGASNRWASEVMLHQGIIEHVR